MLRVKPNDKLPTIIAEWRTGNYTQAELAYNHDVSIGFVNKHCKGVPQDTALTVNKIVESRQELSVLDGFSVNAVNAVADMRTQHLVFFTSVAIQNVKEAMAERCEGQSGYRHRAETIARAKDVVLGKDAPVTTTVNINQDNRSLNVCYQD